MIKYLSDNHFGHSNIIKYSFRPFSSVEIMDEIMERNLRKALDNYTTLVHCGDLAWRSVVDFFRIRAPLYGGPHHIVLGNHDKRPDQYSPWFQHVHGTPKRWTTNHLIIEDVVEGQRVKVLCTHAPQDDLQGCDYNVHGHVHEKTPGWSTDRHLNACVEVVGYTPRTLRELIKIRQQGTCAA